MTRHLFVINPTAGKTDSSALLREQIEALGLTEPYTVAVTAAPGDTTRIVKEALADTDDFVRIYACGGDGTLNDIVNGAAGHSNCAVGVVPVGSGNDFVRCFDGLTRDDFLNLAAQVRGSTKTVDLMQVGDRYCINVVSCGYDCAVGKNMQIFKNWPLVSGSAAYKLSLLYSLVGHFSHRFRLLADGEPVNDPIDEKQRYIFAVAGNGMYYGGGFKASPRSVLDDGLLDFVRIPKVSYFTFFRYVNAYKKGEHLEKMKMARWMRCKQLQICADHPVDMNVDGEILTMTNPIIRIADEKISFILPAREGK